jgi:hypothetical protein
METKQTAMQELIQWLKIGWKDEDVDTAIKKAEQLLEMEKDQIIYAHQAGWSDAYDYYVDDYSEPAQAKDYYDETYGK